MKVKDIKVVSCEDTNINDSVVDELYENWCGSSVYGEFIKVEFLKGLFNDYIEELKFDQINEHERIVGVLEEIDKLLDEWYVEFE